MGSQLPRTDRLERTVYSSFRYGAHFYKCDLQVPTPRDARWSGGDAVTEVERKAYAEELILACRQKGYFEDTWMLEGLIETLQKTRGAIAGDFHALERWRIAPTYPKLCVRALSLIVKSRSMERWQIAKRLAVSLLRCMATLTLTPGGKCHRSHHEAWICII